MSTAEQRARWRAQWAGRTPQSRRVNDWPTEPRRCIVCPNPIPRHELDTDRTYYSRKVCSRACMRAVKGTQADRGRMAWPRVPEPQQRDLP